MGSWIGITLQEVGGASACGGLEAEGQEFFASCLSEAILKRSAPEPKGPLSQLLIPNIPRFHRSMGFNSPSELSSDSPDLLMCGFPFPHKLRIGFAEVLGGESLQIEILSLFQTLPSQLCDNGPVNEIEGGRGYMSPIA